MSESINVLNIKKEADCSAKSSHCSPTSPECTRVRSNSFSNGANTNSSSCSSVSTGGGAIVSTPLSGRGQSVNNKIKCSPAVSPRQQLYSSALTLSSDLNSVSISSDHNANTSTSYATCVTSCDESPVRDELRRLCLVCGDVASGFHYGVASCEACKAFFKRTIQGNIEYTCPASNECEINKRRRKACQACRFQKCLLMGMLKEGVRLDRVRGGRQKYRRNPVSTSYQTMQSQLCHSSTTSLDDVKILEVLNLYEPDTLSTHQLSRSSSNLQQLSTVTQIKIEQNLRESTSNHNESCNRKSNIDSTCIFPLSNNNNNDSKAILNILGDIYDNELVGVIGWAKQIPGFSKLPLNDQMKLLQVSWAEILTFQLIFRSLPFKGKFCFATDIWMDEVLAKECGYSEFFYHCVHIAQRLERLSLRREEYYLLKALLLSNCDIFLDDQSSLCSFRETILNALNDVVYIVRHGAAVSHQQQLLLLLPSLRQADNILRSFWRKIRQDGAVTMKILFVEMLEPIFR